MSECQNGQNHERSIVQRKPLCWYYSSDPDTLQHEIAWCRGFFSGKERDKSTSKFFGAGDRNVPILIVPHGAFCDSGPLVAAAFERYIPRDVDIIIFIGTEHESCSRNKIYCCNILQWATPLGILELDEDALKHIHSFLPIDNVPFLGEHSIENQLPFLQSMLMDQPNPWKMVALNVHGCVEKHDLLPIQHAATNLANAVRDIQRRTRKKVAVVATTDYTHAGPGYGEIP